MTTETPKKSVKIVEAFTPNQMVFDSKEDFIKYMNSRLPEFKDYSTYKLNKLFAVKGYRVTKIKGEIGLCTDHYISKEKLKGKVSNGPDVTRDMKLLDEKIAYLTQVLKDNGLIEDEASDEDSDDLVFRDNFKKGKTNAVITGNNSRGASRYPK
jgi:hypothetical protein